MYESGHGDDECDLITFLTTFSRKYFLIKIKIVVEPTYLMDVKKMAFMIMKLATAKSSHKIETRFACSDEMTKTHFV